MPSGSRVWGEGPPDSRLAIIGEAPASVEVALGRPFVGPSGHKLNTLLQAAGLERGHAFVDNVYPFQAPGNKIERADKGEVEEWSAHLHGRLKDLPEGAVVVPLGNVALKALTGEKGITRRRGYPHSYLTEKYRHVTVIPSIHPAAFNKQPKWELRCRHDWLRVKKVLEYGLPEEVARQHDVGWDVGKVSNFYEAAKRDGGPLALDIETNANGITCVGWALTSGWSITWPSSPWKDGKPVESGEHWWVKMFADLPNEKITHNGLFDAWWLARAGVTLKNWVWDTLAMQACLEPTSPHSLLYCASTDVWTPYWKDMRDFKDAEEGGSAFKGDPEVLWRYNGIDACVTRELFDVYFQRLVDAGKLAFYMRHFMRLFRPLLGMMVRGVKVDDRHRRTRLARLMVDVIEKQDKLTAVAGTNLFGPKGGLSPKKLQTYLYTTLRLPKRVKDGKVTANEAAVRGLMQRFPAKVGEAGGLIIQVQQVKKQAEFVADKLVGKDGRARCTYKLTTETGRLASAEAADGTGRNHQNIPQATRSIFVAEPGHVVVEVDASQAESRVVGVLTGDVELGQLARSKPWVFDVHRFNAAIVFHLTEDRIDKDQRYIGKRAVHASNYGMRKAMLSDILLNDGYVRTLDECEQMIEAYMARFPAIREWQKVVRQKVMTWRVLKNAWGRELPFTWDRLDDDAYRRAYAFEPQSSVADLTNQAMAVVDRAIEQHKLGSRLMFQVHDSLVFSCPPHEVETVVEVARRELEREVVYRCIRGKEQPLSIPVEVKMGVTWAPVREWKRPPEPGELAEAAKELLA